MHLGVVRFKVFRSPNKTDGFPFFGAQSDSTFGFSPFFGSYVPSCAGRNENRKVSFVGVGVGVEMCVVCGCDSDIHIHI